MISPSTLTVWLLREECFVQMCTWQVIISKTICIRLGSASFPAFLFAFEYTLEILYFLKQNRWTMLWNLLQEGKIENSSEFLPWPFYSVLLDLWWESACPRTSLYWVCMPHSPNFIHQHYDLREIILLWGEIFTSPWIVGSDQIDNPGHF